MVSIGQRRLSQRSIKGAEEETKELLNKPSTIPSEEVQDDVFILFSIYSSHQPSQQEDFDMPDVLPTNVENETSPVFVVGTSKHEEDLDSDT